MCIIILLHLLVNLPCLRSRFKWPLCDTIKVRSDIMTKNRKLNLLQFTILNGYIGLLIGIIAGILYSFGGLIIDSLVSLNVITSLDTPGLSSGTLLAFGALIGMPILFALFGLVFGILGGILYNTFYKFLPFTIMDLNQ